MQHTSTPIENTDIQRHGKRYGNLWKCKQCYIFSRF
jgi:hypothetical protein